MRFLGYIFFDLDGTLVDTLDGLAVAFSTILEEEFGIPPSYSQSEFIKTAGSPLDEQYRHVLRERGSIDNVDVNRLVERFWKSIQSVKPVLFPEVKETLKVLNRQGYVLLVSSSTSQHFVDAVLKQTRIGRYIRLAFGTDYQYKLSSKGEKHFRLASQKLGVSYSFLIDNAAFVGDTEFDMNVARSARMFAIYRARGEHLPVACDAAIYDLADLLALLRDEEQKFIPIKMLRGVRKATL